MIAPEQWYEFQQQYQKYGLDMKPPESREHREKRRQAARLASSMEMVLKKDRKLMMAGLVIIVTTMILLIVLTAYAASIRYDISVVESENGALWDEIKHLQSSQTTKNGVGYVEEKASKELGMITAGSEHLVYITSDDMPAAGFADVLKAKAYQ